MTPSDVRQILLRGGYDPLPLVGKRPIIEGWQKRDQTSAGDIEIWSKLYPYATNTGCLTRRMPSLDIDILNADAAQAVEDLIRDRYGHVLVRIGKPPKRAILFRTEEVFKKITVNLTAPNGAGEKIEFLCDGQQLVVNGVHPDTGQSYHWHGGEPGQVLLAELPYISGGEAQQLVTDVVALLEADFGYRRPQHKGHGAEADLAGASDWKELTANIIAGRALHDSLRDLAAKMTRSGTSPGAAINQLRALMEASAAPRDDRWRDRNAEIPRLVESAEEKFRASNGVGLQEWNAALDREAPPPRAWLLGNSLCRRYVSSLLAGGGTGKSAMRILQALALATGRRLTDEHVFQRCRVLIVSLEDDADELRRRILAACLHYDIARSELDGWLFLAAPGASAGKLKAMNAAGQIVDGQLRSHLEAAIERHHIDCVIIDPLVKAHSIEENSNSAVDGVLQLLSELAIRYDIAVDVPHHTSKGQDRPGDAHRGRGASALIDATRLAYTLTPMSEAEAQQHGISEGERRQYVRYDRAKVNLAAIGGRETWFKLIGVRIGNETDMYPNGDEVQTVEVWNPPRLWADLPDARLNSMLTEIDRGLPDSTFYTAAPNASTRAAWQVVRKHAPEKSEQEARKVIQTWLRSGLLVEFEYNNPETRKTVKGLRVDNAKRPGTICALD